VLFEFLEHPSLSFEALLVDAPFGGDAVLVFLCPGAGAPRHHHTAVLGWFGGEFADRDFACGSGQYREEQAAAGFGGVGPAGRRCPYHGGVGQLPVGPAADAGVEGFQQMMTPES
jgi:hypothetical protein